MVTASICTIGDEILIGQIVDTNSSEIAKALGSLGIMVNKMISIGDRREDIIASLSREAMFNDIIVVTGGLGPTKDDITKSALAQLSHSKNYKIDEGQLKIINDILCSRGLEVLDVNKAQAMVPDNCDVILNRLGTAPIMVFSIPVGGADKTVTLYSMPGVPFEAIAALPDVMDDIKKRYSLSGICHRNIMTYGLAESALSKKIEDWEDSLPESVHLAYLPNTLTGVHLRLSIYGCDLEEGNKLLDKEIDSLKSIIGDLIYSYEEDTLEGRLGKLLKSIGKTVSSAESCTGGEIAHLITSVAGASEYYIGSVVSYAIQVKENVLKVPQNIIKECGVVSSEVAAAMAKGVLKLTGSDFSVATTGLAGPGGGDANNPEGTVWVGVASKNKVETIKFQYNSDRQHNIERFSASALNFLIKFINSECKKMDSSYSPL